MPEWTTVGGIEGLRLGFSEGVQDGGALCLDEGLPVGLEEGTWDSGSVGDDVGVAVGDVLESVVALRPSLATSSVVTRKSRPKSSGKGQALSDAVVRQDLRIAVRTSRAFVLGQLDHDFVLAGVQRQKDVIGVVFQGFAAGASRVHEHSIHEEHPRIVRAPPDPGCPRACRGEKRFGVGDSFAPSASPAALAVVVLDGQVDRLAVPRTVSTGTARKLGVAIAEVCGPEAVVVRAHIVPVARLLEDLAVRIQLLAGRVVRADRRKAAVDGEDVCPLVDALQATRVKPRPDVHLKAVVGNRRGVDRGKDGEIGAREVVAPRCRLTSAADVVPDLGDDGVVSGHERHGEGLARVTARAAHLAGHERAVEPEQPRIIYSPSEGDIRGAVCVDHRLGVGHAVAGGASRAADAAILLDGQVHALPVLRAQLSSHVTAGPNGVAIARVLRPEAVLVLQPVVVFVLALQRHHAGAMLARRSVEEVGDQPSQNRAMLGEACGVGAIALICVAAARRQGQGADFRRRQLRQVSPHRHGVGQARKAAGGHNGGAWRQRQQAQEPKRRGKQRHR
eukprot:scaffold184_cov316-Pinguiococcus_pyrenoidosus.AAC.50